MTPLVLAIQATGDGGGLALARGGVLLASTPLPGGARSAQQLLPELARWLDAGASAAPHGPIGLVAVDVGPGGYTATRIGVMAAKAVAYAARAALAGVQGLAALAWSARQAMPGQSSTDFPCVAVARISRRDEIYWAVYACDAPPAPVEMEPLAVLTPDEAASRLAALAARHSRVHVAGDAAAPHGELWRNAVIRNANVAFLPELAVPPAEAIAYLGALRQLSGETDDPLILQPLFPRRAGDGGWRTQPVI